MNRAMPESAGEMPWMLQGPQWVDEGAKMIHIIYLTFFEPSLVSEFFRYCYCCKLDDLIWFDICRLSDQGGYIYIYICRKGQFWRDIRDIRKSTLAFYLHGVTNLTKCFRSCIQDALLIRPWPRTTVFKTDRHGASMHALIRLVSFSDQNIQK